ncbi:MAG: hypothetical protein RL189_24 [Pseudomonadota bacterium]
MNRNKLNPFRGLLLERKKTKGPMGANAATKERRVSSTNALAIAIFAFTRADSPEQPLIKPAYPAGSRFNNYPTQGALSG